MSASNFSEIHLETLRIEVVFSPDGKIWHRHLSVPAGFSIAQALNACGIFTEFPELSFETVAVGIFGKHLSTQHILEDHDRIEIYSPLRVDPKIARRRRAAHREKIRNIKKKMPINDLTR